MFEEKPVETPPNHRDAAGTWSPGDKLVSVPLKGDIPHLLSLALAAGLHGSRQEFGISREGKGLPVSLKLFWKLDQRSAKKE